MTKAAKQAHIIALFGAMINKIPVIIDDNMMTSQIIQRINLDGECDIYSKDFDEVIAHDVNPFTIKIHANK